MRSLLILQASWLAGIVAFLVAWPRLVDADVLRSELVRLLRTAGVAEGRFQGAVRLELLPLPRISIERVVLGDRTANATSTRFEADRIDVEIAPLSLLAGRLEPRRLQLVRPRLSLATLPTNFADQALRALDGGDLAGMRRLDIIDGSVSLLTAEGSEWPRSIDALDLVATREGPTAFGWKARLPSRASRFGWNWLASRCDLGADRPETRAGERRRGGPRDPRPTGQSAARSGWIAAGRPAAGGDVEGAAAVVAGPRAPSRAGCATIRPAGRSRPVGGSLRLDDLELALGGGALRGAFALDLVSAPHFDLTLDGTELVATPELVAELRALGPLVASGGEVTGRVELRAATIAWRGGQIRRLRAELALAWRGRLDLRRLSATLPGDTALTWDGTGPASDGALVGGSLSVQSGELVRCCCGSGSTPPICHPERLDQLGSHRSCLVGL